MSTSFFTRSRCQIIRTKGVNKKEESNRSRSRGAQQFYLYIVLRFEELLNF